MERKPVDVLDEGTIYRQTANVVVAPGRSYRVEPCVLGATRL